MMSQDQLRSNFSDIINHEISLRTAVSSQSEGQDPSNELKLSRLLVLSNVISEEKDVINGNNQFLTHDVLLATSLSESKIWRGMPVADNEIDLEANNLSTIITHTSSKQVSFIDSWLDIHILNKRAKYSVMECARSLNETPTSGARSKFNTLVDKWDMQPEILQSEIKKWLDTIELNQKELLSDVIKIPYLQHPCDFNYLFHPELHSSINQRLHYELKTSANFGTQRKTLTILRLLTWINFKLCVYLRKSALDSSLSIMMCGDSADETEACQLLIEIFKSPNKPGVFPLYSSSEHDSMVNMWLLKAKFPLTLVEGMFCMYNVLGNQDRDAYVHYLTSWWLPLESKHSIRYTQFLKLIQDIHSQCSTTSVWIVLSKEEFMKPLLQGVRSGYSLIIPTMIAISQGTPVQRAWENMNSLVSIDLELYNAMFDHMEHVAVWLKLRGDLSRGLSSSLQQSLSSFAGCVVSNCSHENSQYVSASVSNIKHLLG